MTDPQHLKQIIGNLLKNAIKFTSDGAIICHARINTDNQLIVTVTDTGCGIEADKQQQIFDAFEQADNSWSREFEGAGLGLTLSRRYAQLLGGDINLQSKRGEGSVFTLCLPLV